jgi:hypothetical protein
MREKIFEERISSIELDGYHPDSQIQYFNYLLSRLGKRAGLDEGVIDKLARLAETSDQYFTEISPDDLPDFLSDHEGEGFGSTKKQF